MSCFSLVLPLHCYLHKAASMSITVPARIEERRPCTDLQLPYSNADQDLGGSGSIQSALLAARDQQLPW